jgi:hypothetical protein
MANTFSNGQKWEAIKAEVALRTAMLISILDRKARLGEFSTADRWCLVALDVSMARGSSGAT